MKSYEVYITKSGKMNPMKGTLTTVIGWRNARNLAASKAEATATRKGYAVEFHGEPFLGDWCMYHLDAPKVSLQVRINRIDR